MSEPIQDLFNCPYCGGVMDLASIPPFTRAKCPHCGEETRVKTRMGRYELKRRLGIGGMSYVFAAWDASLEREVAVKILNEQYGSDAERIAQFEREAKITASLSHPNIVRVFTVGEDLGRFFIAMELVEGDSLEAEIRRRGAIPEEEILSMAIEVAHGLSAAHEAGLIHRDVKPGNILIDSGGRPRLVDFGLALLTDEADGSQEIWATPYYVPPETLEGQDEDFRSDMYALGASLYHALAGRPPCPDDSLSVDELKIAKRGIEPLDQAASHLNRSTVEVVELAMAHAPGDRFENYEALLDALNLALHSVRTGVTAPPIYGSRRSRRRFERDQRGKRLVIGVGAILGATLITGAILISTSWFESLERDRTSDDKPRIDEARSIEAAPEEDAMQEVGTQIAEIYDATREQIRDLKFLEAAQSFQRILDQPDAPSKTICWVSFEAAACYYQDGKSGEARDILQRLRRYLEEQGARLDGTAASSDWLAGRLLKYPLVKEAELPKQPQGIEKLAYYVAGLKNWEQGQFEQGKLLFERFVSIELTDATDALGVYQKLAQAYMRDADRLAKARPLETYHEIEEIKDRRQIIDATYAALETRGRARFEVREWNLRLAKRERELREQLKAGDETGEMVDEKDFTGRPWERVEFLVSEWRFDEALDQLSEMNSQRDEKVDSFFYLIETVQNFRFNLVEILQIQKPILEAADGRKFGTFDGLIEGKLRVKTAEGEELLLAWKELSSSQVDQLFLDVAKAQKSQFERNLRFEQLITFNYLVGDRQRALNAAQRIENEAFRARWRKVMSVLEDRR